MKQRERKTQSEEKQYANVKGKKGKVNSLRVKKEKKSLAESRSVSGQIANRGSQESAFLSILREMSVVRSL